MPVYYWILLGLALVVLVLLSRAEWLDQKRRRRFVRVQQDRMARFPEDFAWMMYREREYQHALQVRRTRLRIVR